MQRKHQLTVYGCASQRRRLELLALASNSRSCILRMHKIKSRIFQLHPIAAHEKNNPKFNPISLFSRDVLYSFLGKTRGGLGWSPKLFLSHSWVLSNSNYF
ncbi:unnamed protein product [Ixodes persulcatus]